MANYNQAPILRAIGDKERKGFFVYRPQELEYAMCCCLGNRDMVPLKTMLFFTGNATDGSFRIAQKTIYDRMNISEKRYYDARKKLEEMHWIHYDSQENAIYVNYNKIYADYKAYLEKQKDARGRYDSSIPVSIYDRAVVNGLQEQSSYSGESDRDDSQRDCSQDRHNKIRNIISNNIINKKSSGAGAGGAPPPQFCIDLINQFKSGSITKNEAMDTIEKWYCSELSKYRKENNLSASSEEYRSKDKELNEIGTRCWDIFKGRREDYYD